MKEPLERTESCIAFDRLTGELTAAEREHLSGCARCEAELALAQEFESSETSSAESEAVESIVARLQRKEQPAANVVSLAERRKRTASRSFLAVAATLVLALGVTWFVQNRDRRFDEEAGIDRTYRSLRVELLAPAGDVSAAPTELQWRAVPGAAEYTAAIVEVDGTPLWSATTRDTRIALPPAVSARFVPGKTVLWQVTARSDGGDRGVLADSGTLKFRVVRQ